MKIRAAALVVLLSLFAYPVAADEDPSAILPEAAPLRDRWERCAADKVRPLIKTRIPAEAAANRALAACKAEENAVRSLLTRRIGSKEAFTVIELVRNTYRVNLTGIVDRLRDR